jgi:hypothetical protein
VGVQGGWQPSAAASGAGSHRGVVPFGEKARRAQQAEAVGVIFVNSSDDAYVPLGVDADTDITLPIVCIGPAPPGSVKRP